ncbi:MAG: SGNH/GDSL hydrolase family protein [Verrucomicrobiota bacterium]
MRMTFGRIAMLVALGVWLSLTADGWSQSTATASAKWEKDIRAFEQMDRTNPPPKNAVLFVGSSSIRLWKTLAEDFPKHRVINRGFGGSQVADSVAFAERIILPHQPRMVVVYAGDNDLAAGKSPTQVLADFQALVGKIHGALPATKIRYIAVKPSLKRQHLLEEVRETNRLIAEYCRQDKRLGFVDIATPMIGKDGYPRAEYFVADGLHMTAAGYQVWTRLVAKTLK